MCKNRNILSAYMDELKLRGSGVQSAVSPDADGGQGSGRCMQCVRDLKHGERVHIHAWLKTNPSQPNLSSNIIVVLFIDCLFFNVTDKKLKLRCIKEKFNTWAVSPLFLVFE